MDLLDLLRAYPGGIAQLAKDTEVREHTLYRLGNGEHRKKPVQVIESVARAFQGKVVLGVTYDAPALAALWDVKSKAAS